MENHPSGHCSPKTLLLKICMTVTSFFTVLSPVVIKHVLLINAVIRAVFFFWIPRRIFVLQDPPDPYVDGKCVNVVQSKQRHTIRYLHTDAADCCQCFDRVRFRCFCQPVQVQPAFRHFCCRCPYISAAISQPARRKCFIVQGKDLLGCREGIITSSLVLPLTSGSLAEQFHTLFDRWDVLILGNDKADQHLPGILPEDPDAFPKLAGIG